jgi:hypothetical protein
MTHYPCQTADGRTYVMRSRGVGEPVIVMEVTSTPDTTRRWRIAKGHAKALNRAASGPTDWPIAILWGGMLAFFGLAVIVAVVLVGK